VHPLLVAHCMHMLNVCIFLCLSTNQYETTTTTTTTTTTVLHAVLHAVLHDVLHAVLHAVLCYNLLHKLGKLLQIN
jgi:hypothetical protein